MPRYGRRVVLQLPCRLFPERANRPKWPPWFNAPMTVVATQELRKETTSAHYSHGCPYHAPKIPTPAFEHKRHSQEHHAMSKTSMVSPLLKERHPCALQPLGRCPAVRANGACLNRSRCPAPCRTHKGSAILDDTPARQCLWSRPYET